MRTCRTLDANGTVKRETGPMNEGNMGAAAMS